MYYNSPSRNRGSATGKIFEGYDLYISGLIASDEHAGLWLIIIPIPSNTVKHNSIPCKKVVMLNRLVTINHIVVLVQNLYWDASKNSNLLIIAPQYFV